MAILENTLTFEDRPATKSYVCWSRMQNEAGQSLERILLRKENERLANDGVFYWGVGNAPSTLIAPLSRMGIQIPMIFSVMKGKAKAHDSAPSTVVVWRRYIDANGSERPLPRSALVTSRGDSAAGVRKNRHFALVCHSSHPLRISKGKPFDHRAYRNAGVNGGPIGSSQVTALLVPSDTKTESLPEYEANLEATLIDGYWVRLTDPVQLSENQLEQYAACGSLAPTQWLEFVAALRQKAVRSSEQSTQLGLF